MMQMDQPTTNLHHLLGLPDHRRREIHCRHRITSAQTVGTKGALRRHLIRLVVPAVSAVHVLTEGVLGLGGHVAEGALGVGHEAGASGGFGITDFGSGLLFELALDEPVGELVAGALPLDRSRSRGAAVELDFAISRAADGWRGGERRIAGEDVTLAAVIDHGARVVLCAPGQNRVVGTVVRRIWSRSVGAVEVWPVNLNAGRWLVTVAVKPRALDVFVATAVLALHVDVRPVPRMIVNTF